MNTVSSAARPTSTAIKFWARVAELADGLDEEEREEQEREEQERRERREVHAA